MKKFIYSGVVHQKMSDRLPEHVYEMDLLTLKGKVLTFFENKHEAAWIDFPDHDLNGSQRFAKEQRAMDILNDDGFVYKKQFYRHDNAIDLDALALNSKNEWARIKAIFKTNGIYHLLEDSPDHFMIVKGNKVYRGEARGDGKSFLRISKMTSLKNEPMNLNVNIMNLLLKQKLIVSLERGPVSLEKSLEIAERDAQGELTMLHFLDRPTFDTWKSETAALYE